MSPTATTQESWISNSIIEVHIRPPQSSTLSAVQQSFFPSSILHHQRLRSSVTFSSMGVSTGAYRSSSYRPPSTSSSASRATSSKQFHHLLQLPPCIIRIKCSSAPNPAKLGFDPAMTPTIPNYQTFILRGTYLGSNIAIELMAHER